MKIVLMAAPVVRSEDQTELDGRNDRDNSRIPIGLYSLGSLMVERQHDVKLKNFSLVPFSKTVEEICDVSPDLLGISCYTANRYVVMAICIAVKKRRPGVKIILGGPHPSPLYQMILEDNEFVDFVAVGESEVCFPELVDRLDGGHSLRNIQGVAFREDGRVVFNGQAPLVQDLDTLPIPSKYYSYDIISTSRGCPGNCTFCSSPGIWGKKIRYRSTENILEEIELLITKHNISQIAFKDDTFTTRKSRLIKLMKAMIDRRYDFQWSCDTRVDSVDEEKLFWMKKGGCRRISYGVESGSEIILKELGKKTKLSQIKQAAFLTRKFCIDMRYYLIVGNLGETNETLGETIRLIEETKPNACFISKLNVTPGTQLFENLLRQGRLSINVWLDDLSPVIFAPANTPVEQYVNYTKLVRTYHVMITKRQNPQFAYTVNERLKALDTMGGTAFDNYLVGREFYDQGSFMDALPRFRKALEQDDTLSQAFVYQALCHENLSEGEKAERVWRQLLKLKHPGRKYLLFALLQLGRLYLRNQQYHLAQTTLAKLVERDATVFEAFSCLGEVFYETGSMEDALNMVGRAVDLNPDYPDAYNILGKCYSSVGDFTRAEKAFWMAIEKDITDKSDVYNNLGVVSYHREDMFQAKKYFEKALAKNPGNRDAKANLGALQFS